MPTGRENHDSKKARFSEIFDLEFLCPFLREAEVSQKSSFGSSSGASLATSVVSTTWEYATSELLGSSGDGLLRRLTDCNDDDLTSSSPSSSEASLESL